MGSRGPLTQLHMKSLLALEPPHIEGKQRERKGGGLGNLRIFSIVIFISFILTFSCFPSVFLLLLCLFRSYHILSYLYSTASCAVCLSPLTLLLLSPPPPPRSSMFEVIRPGLRLPLSLPPSELCLLTISYFLSASSPSSCSFATKMAAFHDLLAVTWPSSRS